MSRKEAREIAFKTIYSKFFNTEAEVEEQSNVEDLEFTTQILTHFANHYEEINELIASHLKGYTINRVYKIDLAILVLAVIELDYIKENPKQVVINEAVELAKVYGGDNSPSFINASTCW